MTSPPKYSYTLLKTHKTAFDRQVWEGVYISFEKSDHILNGKGEWGMNLFPKLWSHQDIINEGTETSLQSSQDKLSNISFASPNSQKRSGDDRVIANHCVSNTGAKNLNQDSMSEFNSQFQQSKKQKNIDGIHLSNFNCNASSRHVHNQGCNTISSVMNQGQGRLGFVNTSHDMTYFMNFANVKL